MKKRRVVNYINNPDLYKAMVDYKQRLNDSKQNNKSKPQVSDYIGKSIIQICTNLSRKSNFAGYCVDIETEALTQRGWLKYHELTLNDIILSYDIKSCNLVWSKICNIYCENYEGLMHKLNHRKMDSLVTPGHKFVTHTGLKNVNDLSSYDHIFVMGEHIKSEITQNYTNAFVELMGWFVTEGCIEEYQNKRENIKTYYIDIYQDRKANFVKCLEIESCLNELNNYYGYNIWTDRPKSNSYYIKTKLYNELVKNIYIDDNLKSEKILKPEFILSLTQEQKVLLITTMIKGDGSYGCCQHGQYVQKSKKHVDMFLMLCTLAGFTTRTSYSETQTPFGIFKGYVVTLSKSRKCSVESINFHGGKRSSGGNWNLKKNFPTEPYNDIIWCPETEYGTWICRRGKNIYVTGNSWVSDMISDGIVDCIAGVDNFDPGRTNNPFAYFTQIAWNAFLRRIEKEKKQTYIKHKNYSNMFVGEDFGNEMQQNEYSDEVIKNFENKLTNIQKKPMIKGVEKFIEEKENT